LYPVPVKVDEEADMRCARFMRIALFLAVALLALGAGRAFPADGPGSAEKTIPVPKTGQAELKFDVGPLVIEEIIIRNVPDDEDLAKAKGDPSDKCHPKLQVGVTNKGSAKTKFHLQVQFEDKDGNIFMSCDRNDDIEPGAVNDHTNLCWLDSMKTLDWPKVTVVRVVAKVSP
jgi:hypothetical protein